jgi:hypothetical protein
MGVHFLVVSLLAVPIFVRKWVAAGTPQPAAH